MTTETPPVKTEPKQKRPEFTRHAAWFNQSIADEAVIIVGCGAVGSNVALGAAKMGYSKFIIFDKDEVEPHNLPNQAFFAKHIGMPKVEALKDVLLAFDPTIKVETHNDFFTEDTELSEGGQLVIATDSMASRAMLAEFFDTNVDITGVFDARLGFDFGMVNLVDPLDEDVVAKFKASLCDDKDVPEGPCNQKICGTLVQVVSQTLVHYMCDQTRTISAGEPWSLKGRRRTMFELSDKLTVVRLG